MGFAVVDLDDIRMADVAGKSLRAAPCKRARRHLGRNPVLRDLRALGRAVRPALAICPDCASSDDPSPGGRES